jgi:hypothetical protein
MYNSIQQFVDKDIMEIQRNFGGILLGTADINDLSAAIHESVLKLGRRLEAELIEELDEEIRQSDARKKDWYVERRNNPKELLDVMGTLRYNRTSYVNRRTGEHAYLVDQVLGIGTHQRITLGSAAKIVEEAVESSYAKGGRRASPEEGASKQTVKKLVHALDAVLPEKQPAEKKKKVKYLHIVADEDHVAAQFWQQKGDLKKGANGQKINTIQAKLICVYEDVINEAGETAKNPRYALTGKRYFSGVYTGAKENEELWQQVAAYIEATYDTDVLERIYIAGDGAAWIKAGTQVLENAVFVLDRFHMMKYANTSTAHLSDYAAEAKELIWEALDTGDKKLLKLTYAEIMKLTESENKREDVSGALRYFLNNWEGIYIRVTDAGGCWRCCAEGQISHVLSDRLSSRPMGWSTLGSDHMAKLRAYTRNGGKIIDLLRYQEEKQKEEERTEQYDGLIKNLRKRHSGWEYEQKINVEIPGLERHSMRWMKNLIEQALG